MKSSLQWMSQPFAHRGLHDRQKGIVENSFSAVRAALKYGFGMEVDVRPAACGTVMVFHDRTLERLTMGTGAVDQKTFQELQKIAFRDTRDEMMSLADLLQLVDGKTPLLLEIKSDTPGDKNLVQRFAKKMISTLKNYRGDYAIMSFEPDYVEAFRQLAPSIARGLISERFDDLDHWHKLNGTTRMTRRFLLSAPRTRPDFVAYDINALPAFAPMIARKLFQRPLLTWTVRTPAQKERAAKYCDAMIFEGFLPTQKRGNLA